MFKSHGSGSVIASHAVNLFVHVSLPVSVHCKDIGLVQGL